MGNRPEPTAIVDFPKQSVLDALMDRKRICELTAKEYLLAGKLAKEQLAIRKRKSK